MLAKEGETIVLDDIGMVVVRKILPSGAAYVITEDGGIWLVPADRLFIDENFLWNFQTK